MHQQQQQHTNSTQSRPRASALKHLKPLKYLTIGTLFLLYIVLLLNPSSSIQQVETLSVKSIAKSILFTRMSQKKNFLPVPVPIPVRIELDEPPVYLKGKPRYVSVYKPEAPPQQPIVKPTTVYHMPVYSPTYEYMQIPDPMSVYGGMMMANQFPSQNGGSKYHHSVSYINFNDYDDETGTYYAVSGGGKTASAKKYYDQSSRSRRSDREKSARVWIMPVEEQESLDNDGARHKRVKRQAYYQSSYEKEPPCYGFPLEINIRSRIKMDQLFPIQGNSQYKKCIKVGRPLLPPVEDDTHY